jgi:hypothetical protein
MPQTITVPARPAESAPAPVDVEKDVSKQGRMLLRIRVIRPAMSNETVVEMQSDFDFLTFFGEEQDGGPISRSYRFGEVECITSRRFSLPSGRGIVFNNGAFEPQGGMNINFSFFMAKNIQTGVKFKFTGRPVSRDGAQAWMQDMKEFAKEVFSAYLRPVDEGYEVVMKPISNP